MISARRILLSGIISDALVALFRDGVHLGREDDAEKLTNGKTHLKTEKVIV